jgi:putative flippase GtrA
MRFINRDFLHFIFWGGINTVAGYLIYVALLRFLPYLVAYSITYVIIVSMSYFLNSRFVFKQGLSLSKAAKYPLVYVTQYLLGIASLYLLVHVLQLNKLLAPALVVLITIPVTYSVSRRIVSGKREK